jgi:hypothetical protein
MRNKQATESTALKSGRRMFMKIHAWALLTMQIAAIISEQGTKVA